MAVVVVVVVLFPAGGLVSIASHGITMAPACCRSWCRPCVARSRCVKEKVFCVLARRVACLLTYQVYVCTYVSSSGAPPTRVPRSYRLHFFFSTARANPPPITRKSFAPKRGYNFPFRGNIDTGINVEPVR